MEETKYEVNIFNDGKWHVKILANHINELENTIAKVKELFIPSLPSQSRGPGEFPKYINGNGHVKQEEKDDEYWCDTHKAEMTERTSKNTGKTYIGHVIGPGKVCFG